MDTTGIFTFFFSSSYRALVFGQDYYTPSICSLYIIKVINESLIYFTFLVN
jgi:hypothetical protein